MKNITRFLKTATVALALIVMTAPLFAQAAVLNRQLELGMSGSDVSALQTFLAQTPSIYPQGLVTGFFGNFTKAAVMNFQSHNGIAMVGRVGPLTLAALNAQMSGGLDTASATISNVNITTSNATATVAWNTSEGARGIVYYSSNPLATYEHEKSVDVSGATAMTDTSYRVYQNVALSGLLSNTTYYYLVYTTDQQGNVSVTLPSTFHTTN